MQTEHETLIDLLKQYPELNESGVALKDAFYAGIDHERRRIKKSLEESMKIIVARHTGDKVPSSVVLSELMQEVLI